MVERVVSALAQPAAAGLGRGVSGVAVVGSAPEDHQHEWRKMLDTVGLFQCMTLECQWFAVCPGCLGSLDVAIRARDGVADMALYWCPAHQGGGEYDSQS